MAKIVPVNNKVLVEQFDKISKKTDKSPFTSVVSNNNLGTVKYSTSPEYPAGMQVYFGNKYERILVEGVELYAVDIADLYAKVLED